MKRHAATSARRFIRHSRASQRLLKNGNEIA